MDSQVISSTYSPLAFAYIGDSVFDLLIKRRFVEKSNMQPEKYHKRVTAIVCAKCQAAFMDSKKDLLSEEELEMFRRGRNAKSHSKAKNASLAEYKKATGFEAMIGYLYLSGRTDRLEEIVDAIMEMAGEMNEK